MSIPTKDAKLLWGKAAGRCAMCRKNVVAEASEAVPSHNILVGEMAHIVGEKNSSPRGISPLSEDDRNRYPNLVLLCQEHHTIVDEDVTAWPVEKLYVLKRDHELWVEEQLGQAIDAQEQVYHDFVDRIGIAFQLNRWEWFCDNAYRVIVLLDFVYGVERLNLELFKAVFPGTKPHLEQAIRNLLDHAKRYVDHLNSNARLDENGFLRAVKFYDGHPERLSEFQKWDRNCDYLFWNTIRALNEFVDVVRRDLRPDYFLRQGHFPLHDSMGVSSEEGAETWYMPSRYYTQAELDAAFVPKP